MRNKCLLGLGLVFVISLTSMVAFAFSFTGTPADEVDETEMIVRAVVSEEADAMPTMEPITTTGQEQEMVKNEQSKIGSMDWDSDDAYRLAKIAMAEAESEDTEGKALVMLVVLNRVWDDEFPDTIEEVIFQKGQFSPISNGRYDEVEPDEDCYRALQLIQTGGWDESHGEFRWWIHVTTVYAGRVSIMQRALLLIRKKYHITGTHAFSVIYAGILMERVQKIWKGKSAWSM